PKVYPSVVQRIRIGLARLICPSRYFPIPLNNPILFTASTHWQEFIRRDSLSLHQATARLLVASARLDSHLGRLSRYRIPSTADIPTLLVLAGRDKIIDNARTRKWVMKVARRVRLSHWSMPTMENFLKIIEYPEASHTLEFETDP